MMILLLVVALCMMEKSEPGFKGLKDLRIMMKKSHRATETSEIFFSVNSLALCEKIKFYAKLDKRKSTVHLHCNTNDFFRY